MNLRLMLVVFLFSTGATFGAPAPSQYFSDPLVLKLVEAASRGDVKGVDAAIKTGANINTQGKDGFVPLAYTMLRLNKKGFSALLQRGADPNILVPGLPGMSDSMVGLAAQSEDTFWITEMIKHKASLNVATSWQGRPPLLIASIYNRTRNVRLMIESGADLEFEDKSGRTVLLAAPPKWETVYMLLEAGADWKKRGPNGHSIIDALLAYSRKPAVDRKSPFWLWRTKVVQWLKDHGADMPEELLNAK